jgi:uracil-DNA glycosylase family 4
MKTDKQQQLDDITADMMRDKKLCPELKRTAITIVPGAGNPNADVVFIGEAPGKNEDLTGKPFVGASGKFLTELIESAGLKREDVFITSIVKYRPPNNRDPKPDEKQQSWPYLLRQLRVINPKLIVTLGRHSMGYFVPDQTISQAHGNLIEGGEWPILPLFHPAAALYNATMRATLYEDFTKLKQILERN